MKRFISIATGVLVAASMATSAMAANWYGASLLSTDTAAASMHQKDFSSGAIKMSGMVVDQVNKLAYISTNVSRDSGKIVVFNYQTGSKVGEINTVNAASQIVIGGDGKAYAVLNERHSNSNNYSPGAMVVRLDNNGGTWSTTKIFDPRDVNSAWADKPVKGIGTDAYGRITILVGSDISKYNSGYVYDPAQGGSAVLMTSGNTGWSENFNLYGNGTPVGVDAAGETVLAIQNTSGINWDGLHLDGTTNRVGSEFGNGGGAGLSGGSTINVYDAARGVLWGGTAGAGGSCLMGVSVNKVAKVAHGPGMNWNTAKVWIGALDVQASTGNAWFAMDGEYATNSTWTSSLPLQGKDAFGHVYAADTNLNYFDQGRPDAAGQVVALSNIDGGNFLALTLDQAGNYKLYSTVPEPSSVLAMLSGLVGMAGFAIRRRK